MRSFFFGLWTTSLFASTMGYFECDIDLDDAAVRGLCNLDDVVAKCLSYTADMRTTASLEQCLITGGCSAIDAVAISEAIVSQCRYSNVLPEEDTYGDLRKRQKTTASTSAVTNAKTTPADKTATPTDKTTSAEQKTTNTPSTTSSPSDTTSATDSSSAESSSTDSPSTSPTASASPASTTSSSASSTTPSPSTTSSTSSTTSSTTTGSSSTTLVCLTTSQVSTTWCTTTTAGASTGTTCFPTSTPVISCAPGLICQTQEQGSTSCMVRQNNLTTSGLVVTIIFGTIVVAFITTLCAMCFKSRRASRRAALAREAELMAGMRTRKNADIEVAGAPPSRPYARGRMAGTGAGASEDHLPLMAAQGSAGNVHSRDGSADNRRPSAHRVPSGTYQDVVAARAPMGAAPRLHPGLMDMGPGGAEEDDMGYRGARGGGGR